MLFGLLLGGIAGFYGGRIDSCIMRVVDLFMSLPTIPLWMGLAAAVPRDWSTTQTYFAITIILSFFGWTNIARVVRGKFLSLREEDYAVSYTHLLEHPVEIRQILYSHSHRDIQYLHIMFL